MGFCHRAVPQVQRQVPLLFRSPAAELRDRLGRGRQAPVSTAAGYVLLVLRDDAFYAIGGQSGSAKMATKMAYGTWETLAELPGRRGCTRPTGSADCIFYRAEEGTWQIRTTDLQATHIAPMRPPCPDGVIIANGLFYWGPWMCQCPLSLYGHVALAPAGKFNYRPGADDSRLEPGEGDPAAVEKMPIARGDWPCYQGDNQRSAVTPIALPEQVTRQWEFQPPAPARPTAPVTAGNMVFVGDDRGVLRALDAASGKVKWEAYTAGAIFLSPAVWEGRVYVGSADGRVYAFEAATGRRFVELPGRAGRALDSGVRQVALHLAGGRRRGGRRRRALCGGRHRQL